MITASNVRLIALAIAGILVAAAVAILASQLASRQIGLASEPVSVGDRLAPPAAKPEERDQGKVRRGASTGTTTSAQPPAVNEPPAASETPAVNEPPAASETPAEPSESTEGQDDSGASEGGGDGGDD